MTEYLKPDEIAFAPDISIATLMHFNVEEAKSGYKARE